MKALIQRVKRCSVSIDGEVYSQIETGMLVFLGVEKGDSEVNAEKLSDKVLGLRIFEDENGRMNYSVKDVGGQMMVVSQFTLCGDCRKGTRPSFDKAAQPEVANALYEYFVKLVRESGLVVQTGKFRAMMDVELVNDGPVTFLVEK